MNETILLLVALLKFSPVEKLPQFPGHEESAIEATVRYAELAETIDDTGATLQEKALVLAWMIGEGGTAKDVHSGNCYREGRWKKRCDGGLAFGVLQYHDVRGLDVGWSVRHAVKLMRASWKACKGLEDRDRFSQFGLGTCVAGDERVRARYALWQRIDGFLRAEAASRRIEKKKNDGDRQKKPENEPVASLVGRAVHRVE